MQEYDRSSKWLIEHYGKALLFLAGVQDVVSCKALQAEVVQPRQLPDGLLEVRFADRLDPDLFLLEISTFPDRRVVEQVLRDVLLVYLDRRRLPEVVSLVLHPKGHLQVSGVESLESPRQMTSLRIQWRVIELWKLSAHDLLAVNEIGLVPWVPLTSSSVPAETLLQECRDRIDRLAPEAEKANLLAVTQVLARLRYNKEDLLAIFGGQQAMIESPLIHEIVSETKQRAVLDFLTERFRSVPPELIAELKAVTNLNDLDALVKWAARCPDLAAFRQHMPVHGNGAAN